MLISSFVRRYARIGCARIVRAAVLGGCCAGLALQGVAQTPALRGGPMVECSGLPCVNVTAANGTHLKMLLDTGNANSLLDMRKAKELGLELGPVNGPDGKPYPNYFVATLKDVMLGDAALGDIKFLVIDLQPDFTKGNIPMADGTLAYTAFRNRLLQLDYKSQSVGVSEILTADIPCSGACGEVTTPTFGKHGPPIVVTTGFAVNGKPVALQVDTMYSGTILIFPTSVEKLGLEKESAATKTRFFPFTDGGVDMTEGVAGMESFGGSTLKKDATLYFATAKVHTPDGMFDGTVGAELFAGHVVTLDFHAHHFWMT